MKLYPWVLGVALLSVACGSSEDGTATEEPATPGETTTAPSDPPTAEDSTSPPPAAGTEPGSAPASPGIFEGAPPYVATLGPSTIDKSGKGNGHLSFNKDGNPAGKACLDCHDGAGKGGAPGFAFAGTIYADAAGTKPAPRVEVRVVGADNKPLTAYTDDNGNFFFRGENLLPAPAMAGARSATASFTMVNKLNDANCNQCHGSTARLTL